MTKTTRTALRLLARNLCFAAALFLLAAALPVGTAAHHSSTVAAFDTVVAGSVR